MVNYQKDQVPLSDWSSSGGMAAWTCYDCAMASSSRIAPLAERLRPKSIAEVVGQRHLLGAGKPLANAIKAGCRIR